MKKRTILLDINLTHSMKNMGGGMEEGGEILGDYWIIRVLQHEYMTSASPELILE